MTQTGYRNIVEALDEGRRRLLRARLTTGLVRAGAIALAALGGAVLGMALLRTVRLFSVPVATAVSLVLLGAVVFAGVRWLLLPMLRTPRGGAFVDLVERRYPGEKNLIVNAYQLGDPEQGGQAAAAPDLVGALVERAATRVRELDLRRWRDPRPDRPYLWSGGAGIAAALVLGLLSPTLFTSSLAQVFQPGRAKAPPVTLRVSPGNLEVDRGADVPIAVAVAGTGKTPVLRYRERNGAWRTRDLAPLAKDAVSRDGGNWETLLPDVDRDLEYALRVAGAESPSYAIQVREPLRLSGFQIHLRFPAYTGLPPETITSGTGDVSALRGTAVDLRVLANRAQAGAELEWRTEGVTSIERRPLTPMDEASWKAEFTIMEPASYAVVLKDTSGAERGRSPWYRVQSVPDRAPFLTLHYPQDDHDLTQDMMERVVADAADDFGFSGCRLVYRVDDDEERVQPFTPFLAGQKEFRLDTVWDMSGLDLLPGAVVSFYLEVLDNDAVSGAKATRSPVRRVRFPSVSEIYNEVAEDHDREIDNLAQLRSAQEELQRNLQKLEDELKTGRDLNWDLRQNMERSLEKQRDLERQLQEMVQRLQETVDKAAQRARMDPNLVQKMSEINSLLQKLQDPDLGRALDQLNQALSRLDRNAMRQALEQSQASQQEMLQGLERTMELLKQVRREEQVEDVVRRTDEIAQLQRDIAEEAGKLQEEMNRGKPQEMTEETTEGMQDPELPTAQEEEKAEPGQKLGDEEKTGEEQKSPEAKPGEQESQPKAGDQKQGNQEKSGEQQSGEEKSGEPKSGEPKSGENAQKDEAAQKKTEQLTQDLKKLKESLREARERLASASDSSASGSPRSGGKDQSDSSEQRMNKMAQNQKQADQLVDELKRTLETLRKLNKDQPQLAKDLEQMEESESLKKLKQSMQQALAGMQQSQPKRASKYAFQARDQASSLAGMARGMQMQMQADQNDEIIKMMERVIQGLIDLSGSEQELVESTDPDARLLARQQFQLSENAEALAESLEAVAKKSMELSAEHQKKLGQVVNRMDRATRLLEQGDRSKGDFEGRESASDLNETLVALMKSHAQMCQGQGSGSQSQQMKQKMEGFSEAQQELNRATREMMERMAGKKRLSLTEAQRLGQLAAQQEMIRRGLEQAQTDYAQLRELLGQEKEDPLTEDMKHVEESLQEQLQQHEADPRVLNRQEQILSRLLDAQRSVRQQEMSPERESMTGTLAERRSPPPLPENLLRRERTLEEDVLRGADDRYPSQYRKLVEAYFRALSREGRTP